jgi:hypothetical protein
MRTPIRPLPDAISRWMWRARVLRWLDAAVAWIVLWLGVAVVFPRPAFEAEALVALALLAVFALVRPLRTRWRPVSAWVGLAMTRRLRPGDRAWWVRPHRSESVVVTARRGTRLTIATARHGEAEVVSVRRTRTLIVPAEGN